MVRRLRRFSPNAVCDVCPPLLAAPLALAMLGGCARPCPAPQATADPRDSRPELDSSTSPRLTVQRARAVTPDEAKAILVARAAIEQEYRTADDWRAELQFEAHRAGKRWLVSVQRMYHRAGVVSTVPLGLTVEIDEEWNATIQRGA